MMMRRAEVAIPAGPTDEDNLVDARVTPTGSLENLSQMEVDRLLDSAVVIRARFKTEPMQRWSVQREFFRRMKKRFDELGIEIPYPHRKMIMQAAEPPKHPTPAPDPPEMPEPAR